MGAGLTLETGRNVFDDTGMVVDGGDGLVGAAAEVERAKEDEEEEMGTDACAGVAIVESAAVDAAAADVADAAPAAYAVLFVTRVSPNPWFDVGWCCGGGDGDATFFSSSFSCSMSLSSPSTRC